MKQFTYLLFFLLLTSQAFAQQKATMAPVNEEFVNYQQKEAQEKALQRTGNGYYLGERPSPGKVHFAERVNNKSPKEIPSSYDLRTEGDGKWISPVRNQGSEGACWAFATYGAVESYILKQGSGQFDLSEQNLATCHNFDWTPSDGGNYYLSAAYLARNSGPISEIDDPYTLPDNRTCVSGLTPSALVQQVRFLPGIGESSYSAAVIKQSIIDNGAVYVNICQEDNYYNSSDYTYYYNGSASTNHAVLLVGWDDSKVVTGGSGATPTSNGAWIIRNSWGPSWGDDGFYYVSYEDTKVLSSVAIFPSDIDYNASEIAYGYDELGYIGSIGYSAETAYGLVKFSAEEAIELSKVGVFIPSGGASVDLTVYSSFNGTSLSGQLGSLSSQTCTYPGYHSFDISSKIALTSGSDFYIKVKITTPDYNYPLATEYAIDNYSSKATIETDKYWISSNGASWSAVGGSSSSAYDLCIKAYANKTTLSADFKSDITTGNTPLAVQFIDMSTGNITSWSWDFDNDGTVESTEQNPSYSFTENGDYTISLTVSDGTSTKTETKTAYVNVNSDFVMQTGSITTDSGVFYDDGGSDGDYNISTKDTLVFYPATSGSYLKFNFTSFETESNYDSLCIFDGSSVEATHLLKKHGAVNPFMVYATNDEGALTFVFYSDGSTVKSGWTANISVLSSIPTLYNMKQGSYTVSEGLFYDGGGKDDNYMNDINDTLTFYPSVTGKVLNFKFNAFDTEGSYDFLYVFDGVNTQASAIGTYSGATLPDDITATNDDGAITFVFSSDYGAPKAGWEAEISMSGEASTIVADFTTDKTSGDAPLAVQFTDASVGTPTTWNWDFNNDGTTDATTQNPSYTFTSAGTYTVKLTASDGTNSDEEIKTDFISVTDPVVVMAADFSVDITSGDAPLMVQFTDVSTGTPTTWAWDFDNDGTTDAITKNPSYTYSTEGVYTVKLTVGDGINSTEKLKIDYITVTEVPEALLSNFKADLTNAVSSLTANFTNLSSDVASTYSWDFNNDGTVDASTKDASYTYASVGTYSVKLSVSDGTVTKDTLFADYIHVMEVADTFKTDWSWQNPKPQGNRINGSFKVSNSLLYAACDGGVIMKSIDGGTTWENKYLGKNLWMYSIHFLNDTLGYVVGEDGTIFKTYDGANTWNEIENNISDDIYDAWFFNENDGIAIKVGRIYSTNNGGFTWTSISHPGSTSYKHDVYFIDENVGFVVGGNSGMPDLLKTTDGGKTWIQKNPSSELDRLNKVFFTSTSTGFIVGDNEVIIKTTDAGESWAQYTFTEANYTDFEGIDFTDANIGYAAGDYKIYKTTDGGTTWEESFKVYGEDFHTIISGSSTNIYALGDAGIINKTADSGTSWEIQNDLLFDDVEEIGFADKNNGFAVSYAGPILKTNNGGVTWTASTTSDYYLKALDVMSAMKTIAVGSQGKIIMTTDGGITWENKTNPENGGLNTVQAVTLDTIYAAGTESLIKSIDGGETWTSLTSPYTYIHGMCFIDAENGFVVGGQYDESKMYKTTDGGTSWSEIILEGIEDQLYDITLANTDTLFLSGSDGIIFRSTDNGTNWTNQSITPPAGVYYYGLKDIEFTDGKHGIAAGEVGLVYSTNNAGETWSLDTTVISSTFYNSIAYVGNKIYFGGSNGTILLRTLPEIEMDLIADFSSDVTTGSNPLMVQFIDESIGDISSWSWDFGDGSSSVEQSPSHTYIVAGTYTVSLAIGDGTNSASAAKNDYIVVIDSISADFSADEVFGEAPLSIQFTDLSEGNITNWSWDFNNDGEEDSDEQNPSYVYTVAGVYSVKLTITSASMTETEHKIGFINIVPGGCNDLTLDYVMNFETTDDLSDWKIIDENGDDKKWGVYSDIGLNATQCAGYQYSSNNAAEDWIISGCFDLEVGVDYEVNFYYAAFDADYSEKLKVFYGTNQDASMNNLIVDLDNITNTDYIKSSNRISVSSNNKYYFGWYCYSDVDKYALLLDSVVIKVAEPLEVVDAIFGADVTSGLAPLEVNFIDFSTGNPTAWSWDFDNDGIEDSDEQNPTYIYTEAGEYGVSLTASNASSSDEFTIQSFVNVSGVGIDQAANGGLACYPNPANDFLYVSFEKNTKALSIFNMQGQKVYYNESIQEVNAIKIDVLGFESGIYFLKIANAEFYKIVVE